MIKPTHEQMQLLIDADPELRKELGDKIADMKRSGSWAAMEEILEARREHLRNKEIAENREYYDPLP